MKIECDEFGDWLSIDGEEFGSSEDGEFQVLALRLRNARLSDIPKGVSVKLCNRMIGSDELYERHPFCTFEHTRGGQFICHGETVFVVEDEDITPEARQQYFLDAINAAKRSLEPLREDGTMTSLEESICEEIAYLHYSIVLEDQPLFDAEQFMDALESRIQKGLDRPLLFVCHASEDKPFVDELVKQLDRRALYVWYDKREILVGESIVGRINQALAKARFLIIVLSPCSIAKPWITREINSTLMRQLAEEKITILPVFMADCALPPLLADLKYADFRSSFDQGLEMLLTAIRRSIDDENKAC